MQAVFFYRRQLLVIVILDIQPIKPFSDRRQMLFDRPFGFASGQHFFDHRLRRDTIWMH